VAHNVCVTCGLVWRGPGLFSLSLPLFSAARAVTERIRQVNARVIPHCLLLAAALPVERSPLEIHDGEDPNLIGHYGVEQPIRKPPD